MRAFLFISGLLTVNFSVYAVEMNFYSCQKSSLSVAKINQQCVRNVSTILQNDNSEEMAQIACADTTTAEQINRIQQCLYNAIAVMEDSSEEQKQKAASIACSGDSLGGTQLQQCLLNAKATLSIEVPRDLSNIFAALACSGSTEFSSVQSCLSQAQSVLKSDTKNNEQIYLAAASACSGAQNSFAVQACLGQGGKKIEANSRMDLIRRLILK